MNRTCHIETASIELEDGSGDGAYDLYDISGTPEEIGIAIGDSLAECDIFTGPVTSNLEMGNDLFLNLRIKISPNIPKEPNMKITKSEHVKTIDIDGEEVEIRRLEKGPLVGFDVCYLQQLGDEEEQPNNPYDHGIIDVPSNEKNGNPSLREITTEDK